MTRLLLLIAAILAAAFFGCTSQAVAPAEVTEEDPTDGVTLYNRNCSVCHGRLLDTSKPGRRPARIKSAIRNNMGGMAFLSKLSDEDISSIADALLLVSPPGDSSGEELYELYCDACHRPFNESDIRGKGVGDINTALKDKMCDTISLEFLRESDLNKITGALGAAQKSAGREPGVNRDNNFSEFKVARFLTCCNVANREPVGAAAVFQADAERVYAFLEARGAKRNTRVYFVWYRDGVEVGRDKIMIGKGVRWRTYCFKFIHGGAGHWRVDVLVPESGLVASAEFDVNQ